MYFSQTWQEILNWTRAFADILIVWAILYYTIKVVRNNSRTTQIFKGIVVILLVEAFTKLLGLSTISWLASMFVSYGFLAIIVIFQPEIRSLLERLGKSNVLSKISTLSGNEKERLVDEIIKSTLILSREQTGALITLEQGQSLLDYIRTGTAMNSVVTTELLTTIFVPNTALHDGAVIIQGDKIACASAYFPPTNMELPSKYGARHRAAIGISEVTDSITIVVSEETGNISIAEGGKIRTVSVTELRDYLKRMLCDEEIEVKDKRPKIEEHHEFTVVSEPIAVLEQKDAPKQGKEKRNGLFARLSIRKQESDKKETSLEDSIDVKVPSKKKKKVKKATKEIKEEIVNEPIQEEKVKEESQPETNSVQIEEKVTEEPKVEIQEEKEAIHEAKTGKETKVEEVKETKVQKRKQITVDLSQGLTSQDTLIQELSIKSVGGKEEVVSKKPKVEQVETIAQLQEASKKKQEKQTPEEVSAEIIRQSLEFGAILNRNRTRKEPEALEIKLPKSHTADGNDQGGEE